MTGSMSSFQPQVNGLVAFAPPSTVAILLALSGSGNDGPDYKALTCDPNGMWRPLVRRWGS